MDAQGYKELRRWPTAAGPDAAAQFEMLRLNREWCRPLRLDEVSTRLRQRLAKRGLLAEAPLTQILARAARQLRRREQAQAVWRELAPAAWQAISRVQAVAGGPGAEVIVAVSTSTALYDMRRKEADWTRQFAQRVPGVRRVRFVVGETAEEA